MTCNIKIHFLNDQTIYCPGQTLSGENKGCRLWCFRVPSKVFYRTRRRWNNREEQVQRWVASTVSWKVVALNHVDFHFNQNFSASFFALAPPSLHFTLWPISATRLIRWRNLNWFFAFSLVPHRTTPDVHRVSRVQVQRCTRRRVLHQKYDVFGTRTLHDDRHVPLRLIECGPGGF